MFICLLTAGDSTAVSTPCPSTLHEELSADNSTQPDNDEGKGEDINVINLDEAIRMEQRISNGEQKTHSIFIPDLNQFECEL